MKVLAMNLPNWGSIWEFDDSFIEQFTNLQVLFKDTAHLSQQVALLPWATYLQGVYWLKLNAF